MSHHFFMGAINKSNNTYEYPKIANKKYKYKCPECEKMLFLETVKLNNLILLTINQIIRVLTTNDQANHKYIRKLK